ncbi:hypothetical protein [Parasediminibacterium sp. JCM 36343]|uniref:hypothetical protein n=1 Tax=Parasediminibacterium sp. JCM 36343 TaxID=3374279 RepID=UPI00397B87B8
MRILLLLGFVLLSISLFSQTTYPKTTTFFGVVHPIVTISSDKPVYNFKDYYLVGFPTGINVWKTKKIGYSLEMIPYVKSDKTISKMSNLLIHPGVLVSLGDGFTFIGRAAFETSGRYGLTPIINKTIIKANNCSYYLSLPMPVRFGNNQPTSLTLAVQFGIVF